MQLIQAFNNTGESIEQGDVVVIGAGPERTLAGLDGEAAIAEVDLAAAAYDTRVCGVVCALHAPVKLKPGDGSGEAPEEGGPALPQSFTPEELEALDLRQVGPGQIAQIAIQGAFAHCKVDADIAPVMPGDLLTTSPTPGHAQKALDSARAGGAVLGKALGALARGKGKIAVLVALQ